MDLVIILGWLVLCVLLLRALVHTLGGDEAEDITFWSALMILVASRFATRALGWVLPDLDLPARIAVNLGVYLLAMTLFLLAYNVRPLRALLISVITATAVAGGGIALVYFLDIGGKT